MFSGRITQAVRLLRLASRTASTPSRSSTCSSTSTTTPSSGSGPAGSRRRSPTSSSSSRSRAWSSPSGRSSSTTSARTATSASWPSAGSSTTRSTTPPASSTATATASSTHDRQQGRLGVRQLQAVRRRGEHAPRELQHRRLGLRRRQPSASPIPQTFRTVVADLGQRRSSACRSSRFNNNVRESGRRAFWDLHVAYFYSGLALIGEWGSGYQDYALATTASNRTRMPVESFYVQAGYLLTGETRSSIGIVKPLQPVQPQARAKLRHSVPSSRTSATTTWTSATRSSPTAWPTRTSGPTACSRPDLGVNWHLTQYVKIILRLEPRRVRRAGPLRPGPPAADQRPVPASGSSSTSDPGSSGRYPGSPPPDASPLGARCCRGPRIGGAAPAPRAFLSCRVGEAGEAGADPRSAPQVVGFAPIHRPDPPYQNPGRTDPPRRLLPAVLRLAFTSPGCNSACSTPPGAAAAGRRPSGRRRRAARGRAPPRARRRRAGRSCRRRRPRPPSIVGLVWSTSGLP